MANSKSVSSGDQRIRWLKPAMIISYALVIVLSLTIVSLLAVKKTDRVLKNKVSNMATSLNVQMKLNLNSYLSRMETIATLAFGEQEAYTYDSTDPNKDEYEAIATEKVISDKLYSLCIMENFVDYGIVYRDNRAVGKLSNGTKNLFGDKIFEDLSAMATRQHSNDGWATGYNNDFTRIYYVKMIHENALLVISFYGSELEAVFDNPEAVSGMDVRLTDDQFNIIYSSVRNEVGSTLPESIASRVKDKNAVTVMDDEYLITVNSSGERWYVICSIPTSIILSEKNDMQLYIYIVALVAALLSVIIGTVLSFKLTAPVKNVVTTLDSKAKNDLLTGILNKRSFEEYTENCVTSSLPTEHHALILLDLDNFKGVNDTLGHAYGDQVLTNVGAILRSIFTPNDYIGRIGGDEFCVCLNTPPMDDENYKNLVIRKCNELCEAFRNNYTGDDGSYKISGSIGIAMFPECGTTFKELYAASDKALYASKKRGKDTYTFYSDIVKKEAEADEKD